MRILFLAPDPGLHLEMTGGAGTHMRGTIKGFRANGHEVLPIVGGDLLNPRPQPGPEEGTGFTANSRLKKVLPGPIRLFLRDLRYYGKGWELQNKAWSQILDFKPQVIYERSGFMNDAGLRIARKLGIPLFAESDGHMVETFASLYGAFNCSLANWLERRKLTGASKVVVMAESALKNIAIKHRQPAQKFAIKKLGVDEAAFVPKPSLVNNLRRQWHLEDNFVVGFVAGQLQVYHGLDLLLATAREIRGLNPRIRFLVIAGGALADSYRERVLREQGDQIIFLGLVDKGEIASYLSLCDVGIIPDCVSHMFPIKVIEYGIMGLCPLAPDYPAFTSLFAFEGKEETLFRARNVENLAAHLGALAAQPELARILAARWRRQVRSQFTWDKVVRPVLSAMEQEILGNSHENCAHG